MKNVLTIAVILHLIHNSDITYRNLVVENINGDFDVSYFSKVKVDLSNPLISSSDMISLHSLWNKNKRDVDKER